MKIETFLPLFSGFYSTYWEFNLDNYLDSENLDFEDIEIDHKKYESDVCKHICDFVAENCPFIKSVEFQSIYSPKEYNFANDSCNVAIELNQKDLQKYMFENNEALNEYLKAKFSSRSGFISFHSNSFDEWSEETANFTKFDKPIQLGTLLAFYFLNEGIEEFEAYEAFEPDEYEFITDLHLNVENLDSYDLKEVAKLAFDTLDQTFGYLAVLVNVYKERAEMFNESLKETICEVEYNFIISESGIKKVTKDLQLIEN